MIVKRKNIILLLGIIILSVPIFYGIYSLAKAQLAAAPVTDFQFKQEKSQQEDFAKSTIVFNNQPYVSDYDEFCLVPFDNVKGEVIVRDQAGNRVYSIKGQDEHNYIMFIDYGEMQIPSIFRKASIPSMNYSNMKFSKIRILNREFSLSDELAKDIVKGLEQIKDSQIMLKPQNVYALDLLSPTLIGLGYQINVYVYHNEFYFASRGYDKCVKTSRSFTLWLKSILENS